PSTGMRATTIQIRWSIIVRRRSEGGRRWYRRRIRSGKRGVTVVGRARVAKVHIWIVAYKEPSDGYNMAKEDE
ncbi:hypothetical protein U1Q18_030661, partial [Sarracenia purpurea var. burkii]